MGSASGSVSVLNRSPMSKQEGRPSSLPQVLPLVYNGSAARLAMNPIFYKRWWAISTLLNAYNFFFVVDSEVKILKPFDAEEVASTIHYRKLFYGREPKKADVDLFIGHINERGMYNFLDQDKQRLRVINRNSAVYFWYNDIPVVEAKTAKRFLEYIAFREDISDDATPDATGANNAFDFLSYSYYCLLYENFSLIDVGYLAEDIGLPSFGEEGGGNANLLRITRPHWAWEKTWLESKENRKLSRGSSDILRLNGVRATFYVVGRNVETYPEIARRIVSEGHGIANHSWSQTSLTNSSGGSRQSHYHRLPSNIAWGEPSEEPRTIFVRTDLVSFFATEVLPCLSHKFVLITGDSDVTLPRQVDKRYPRYIERDVWQQLLSSPLLLHMFAENLDEAGGDKVSGIPLGVNPSEFPNNDGNFLVSKIPLHVPTLAERPLKMQNVDRQRDRSEALNTHAIGTEQFIERKRVLERCRLNWTEICVHRSLPKETFFESLREYPFVKCVHGGGLDPSPKAFEAVLSGTIPIVQHYPGDDAYRELPVVFVDDWEVETITAERLAAWRDKLAPYYEQPELRADVVHRLSAAYWWGKVESALEGRSQGLQNSVIAIEGKEIESAKEW